MMSESVRKYHPFTASQWQELEHQALVYKYMISGMPIPPHLLHTSTATLDSSSSSTKLLLHQPPPPPPHPSRGVGWNCFHQMGFGRKIDPEPGRCRRTDGKKWRCSKEAYPDSKYCERHMHRGRNRSRKPVELLLNSKSLHQGYPSPISHPLSSSSFSSSSDYCYYATKTTTSTHDHFLLESTPYNNSRKGYGMKEEIIDEHSFFSESPSSGAIKAAASLGMGDSWQLQPPGIISSSSSSSKQTPFSGFHHQLALKLDTKDEPQKVMHHFFDEWPPNDDKDSSTTTQLSISIPTSAHDFFLTHNNDK